jgi:hypothetical protein
VVHPKLISKSGLKGRRIPELHKIILISAKMLNIKFGVRFIALQILLCFLIVPVEAQVSEKRDSARYYKITSSFYSSRGDSLKRLHGNIEKAYVFEMLRNDTMRIHNILESPEKNISLGVTKRVEPPNAYRGKDVLCYRFKSGKTVIKRKRKKPLFLIKDQLNRTKTDNIDGYVWKIRFKDWSKLVIYGYQVQPGGKKSQLTNPN